MNVESERPIDATPLEPAKAGVPWRWLVVAGPPLIMATVTLPDLIGTVLAIGWIFVGIPTGILWVLDWYRTPSAGSAWARWARHALRLPILFLGVVAGLIGVSVLAWVAYNVLWQRQPEFQWTGALGVQFGFIAFGWYLIRLALERDRGAVVNGSAGRNPAEEPRRRTSA